LGYHCALTIARLHPEYLVIIASRRDPISAAATINRTLSQSNTIFLPLDLSSPNNVRAFADSFAKAFYPPIIALLQNASLQFPGALEITPDGIEKTFAIAHVGHALLFNLLRPNLAPTARVVITSSGTHDPAQKSGLPDAKYTTAEQLARPDRKIIPVDGRQHYSNAKMVNIMWTYALARRLSSTQMTVVAFDPGLMPGTGLAREYNRFFRFLWNHVMPKMLPLLRLVSGFPNIHMPETSGANLARLAVGDDVNGVSGVYFGDRREVKSSDESYDEVKQEDLWKWTIEHVAKDEDEMRKFEAGY